LVYSLPYTRYDVVVTRCFVGCGDGATQPSYTYAATPAASTHADPTKTYTVDYESLSSAFKTSDLKLTWGDNRTLTAINASATDKTGDVIVNTVTGLATLAVTVASGGAAGKAETVACEAMIRPGARQALDRRKRLEARRDAANARVATLTTRLAALQGVTSQMGQRLDSRVQTTLIALAEQLAIAKGAQEADATATAKNEKELTQIVSVTLAQDGTLSPNGTQVAQIPDGRKTNDWVTVPRTEDNFRARLMLRRAQTAVALADSSEPTELGLRYRVPADGMLVLCMQPQDISTSPGKPFKDGDEQPTDDIPDCTKIDLSRIKTLLPVAPVPQLSRVAVLPFRNGPFQDNSIAATFGADGSPTMVEYKVNTASAETASAAFAKVAAALDTGAKGIVGAPTAILTAKANKVTAQNTLITAQTTNDTAEQIGLLQGSTALLNAQTTNLAAQQALSKQQSAASSP
jgi:hypothetical protein